MNKNKLQDVAAMIKNTHLEQLYASVGQEVRSNMAIAVLSLARSVQEMIEGSETGASLQINISDQQAQAGILSNNDLVISITGEAGSKCEMQYCCDFQAAGGLVFLIKYTASQSEGCLKNEQQKKEHRIKNQLKALEKFQALRQSLVDDDLARAKGVKIRIETNSTQLDCGISNKDDIFFITRTSNKERRWRFACTLEDYEKCELLVMLECEHLRAEVEEIKRYFEEHERALEEISSETNDKYGWEVKDREDDEGRKSLLLTIPYANTTGLSIELKIDESGYAVMDALRSLTEQLRQIICPDPRMELLQHLSTVQCYDRFMKHITTLEDLGWKIIANITQEDAMAAITSYNDFVVEIPFGFGNIQLELQCNWVHYQALVLTSQIFRRYQKEADKFEVNVVECFRQGQVPDEVKNAMAEYFATTKE